MSTFCILILKHCCKCLPVFNRLAYIIEHECSISDYCKFIYRRCNALPQIESEEDNEDLMIETGKSSSKQTPCNVEVFVPDCQPTLSTPAHTTPMPVSIPSHSLLSTVFSHREFRTPSREDHLCLQELLNKNFVRYLYVMSRQHSVLYGVYLSFLLLCIKIVICIYNALLLRTFLSICFFDKPFVIKLHCHNNCNLQ